MSVTAVSKNTEGKFVNNVVSLENFEDINENYLLKAPKKGKIRKGPNWTAYRRENLGTIPRKTEKVLIEDNNSKSDKGFSTQSDRFSGRPDSIKYSYPGPGAYQLSKDFMKTASSFYSSKGYGNGFVSTSERFDDPKLYYEKYYPGPGQYKIDEKISLSSTIDKSLSYKSMYDKSDIKSLKIKYEFPGPGYYNPILITTSQLHSVSLNSKTQRFRQENEKQVPGPGKYFKDLEFTKQLIKKKGNTQSHFF